MANFEWKVRYSMLTGVYLLDFNMHPGKSDEISYGFPRIRIFIIINSPKHKFSKFSLKSKTRRMFEELQCIIRQDFFV